MGLTWSNLTTFAFVCNIVMRVSKSKGKLRTHRNSALPYLENAHFARLNVK